MQTAPQTVQSDLVDLLNKASTESLSDFEMGKLKKCITEFSKINKAKSLGYQAVYLALNGYLKQAKQAYEEAIKLDPNDPELCINFGIFLRNSGKIKEAIANALKAIALAPNNFKHLTLAISWAYVINDQKLLQKLGAAYLTLTGSAFDFTALEESRKDTETEDRELDLYTASLSALREWDSTEERDAWDKL